MPVLVSDALAEARLMLNDVGASLYGNNILLPFARKVYEEYQSWSDNYGLQLSKRETEIVPDDIVGNYVTITYISTPPLPADLRIPIRLYEKAAGDDRSAYTIMEESEFSPVVDAAAGRTNYSYWKWDGASIKLPLLSVPLTRNVLIEYLGSTLTIASESSTVYDLPFKTHFAARIAALAAMYIGQNETRAAACQDDSNTALDRIVETMVRKQQGVFGARRIPFGITRRIRESYSKWWA